MTDRVGEAPAQRVEGWVARDKDDGGTLAFYLEEPDFHGSLNDGVWILPRLVWTGEPVYATLRSSWLPSVLPGTKVRAVLSLLPEVPHE